MGEIHADPEAIRSHADAVTEVGEGVRDGAAAGVASIPQMNFGLIPGPLIYPPMVALFAVIETAMTTLAGVGTDIALGLEGVAELYELTEDGVKTLVEKAGR